MVTAWRWHQISRISLCNQSRTELWIKSHSSSFNAGSVSVMRNGHWPGDEAGVIPAVGHRKRVTLRRARSRALATLWLPGNGDTIGIMVHHAITSSIMVQVLGTMLPLLPMSAMSACRDDDWRRTTK